jgi:hypothetical protein
MWTLRRLVRVDALPDERVVIVFRFHRHRNRLFWLVLQRPDVDLCLSDPGYEINLEIESTVEALSRVCLGKLDLLQALKSGAIEAHGAPRHRSALSSWLGVTRFAAMARKPADSASRA